MNNDITMFVPTFRKKAGHYFHKINIKKHEVDNSKT